MKFVKSNLSKCILITVAAIGCSQDKVAEIDEGTRTKIKFKGVSKQRYPAIIYRPSAAKDNGWAVLMIGGGYGNDLDWTTPGSIQTGSQKTQLTLTGQSHADAPIIAGSLQARGFTVLHYGTIAMDDPLREQWPESATPRKLVDLTEDAFNAMEAMENSSGINKKRIILLGHSLGCARACTLANRIDDIPGLILLAPAYFGNESELLEDHELVSGVSLFAGRDIPSLAVFGGRDTSEAVDYRAAKKLQQTHKLDIHLFKNLGHNLGEVQYKRTGPIRSNVVALISDWAEELVSNTRN